MSLFETLARRSLMQMDAETAHGIGIRALKRGLVATSSRRDSEGLKVDIAGLSFLNPIGIAAGFDKNGEVPDALLKRGVGFAEVGTITPRPQLGNPKPRVFRLKEHNAVINRLGFNNEGHDALYHRLIARQANGGIVGVNIGANKDTNDFASDYVKGIERFADLASYFTANISSPNTPGLRDLQASEALRDLLTRVLEARDKAADALSASRVPVFLKIAPDIDDRQIDAIADEVMKSSVDGLIVSNTTISREAVKGHPVAVEAGGLSGAPLFDASTLVLAKMRKAVGADLPIIGVGGIVSGDMALRKIRAGANLIQLYSGLVYRGFDLIDEIKTVLETAVRKEKVAGISDLVSQDVDELASPSV